MQQKVPKRPKEADDFIWSQIEGELRRRRLGTDWLKAQLNLTRQTLNGWKVRGIPNKHYEKIAGMFGWTLERLTMGEEATQLVAKPEQPKAAPVVKVPEVAVAPDQYSPMALDIAHMFDALPDPVQKRRAYALIVQILTLSAAPSSGDAAQLVGQQTPALRQHQ